MWPHPYYFPVKSKCKTGTRRSTYSSPQVEKMTKPSAHDLPHIRLTTDHLLLRCDGKAKRKHKGVHGDSYKNRQKKLSTDSLIHGAMAAKANRAMERDNKAVKRKKEYDKKCYNFAKRNNRMIARSIILSPVTVVSATQTSKLLIVPDVRYIYVNKKPVMDRDFSQLPINVRHDMTVKASHACMNGNNNKQRPRGFVYTGEALRRNEDVYLINNNHDISITNFIAGKVGSNFISIRYLNNNNPLVTQFHDAAFRIGDTWEKSKKNCSRSVPHGTMRTFGAKIGSGVCPQYRFSMTEHNTKNVNNHHYHANVTANSIAKLLFPRVYSDIHQVMESNELVVPTDLGGVKGLCAQMVQSQHGLINESHVDSDKSRSLSIWSVSGNNGHCCDGSYFVLPYLSTKNKGKTYFGIAVELRHGVAIDWDGRNIFHCSTGPHDTSTNIFGTFFGVTHL